MGHLMLNCKEVTQLVSESLDRKLPFHQRVGIRIHLLMCNLCSRYERQLLFIRKVSRAQKMHQEHIDPYKSLPPEAQIRIKKILQNSLDKAG